MKQFAIALLVTFVAAQQDVAPANSTAPEPEVYVPKVQNVNLPDGKTLIDITRSTSTAVVVQTSLVAGTIEVLQTLFHSPAVDKNATASGHQIFSWINLLGAADDGTNVMLVGKAIYDQSGPRTTKDSFQKCTNLTTLDVVGAPNVLQAVPSTENCNLVVVQSFTQTDVGDFAHSTSAILTANGTDNSMKMGSAVSLSTGYASYMNASADGAALDYFQGEPVSFTLDTASALVMTGVTAAAVAVVSF